MKGYDEKFGRNCEPEFIMCSAIHINDKKFYKNSPDNIHYGYVICGRRHNNCFETLQIFRELGLYLKHVGVTQGVSDKLR